MRKLSATDVLFPVLLLASAVLVAVGLVIGLDRGAVVGRAIGAALLAAGTVGAIGTVLAYAIYSQVRMAREEAAKQQGDMLATVSDRLSSISVLINVMTEQQLISDRAKAVAYRDKDRDALRRAIREETARGDWEAARALVDEMEATFGYRQEAARFRAEIAETRLTGLRRQLQDVRDRIIRMTKNEDWSAAHQEASRFIALNPDFEDARKLPQEIEGYRQGYKKMLLDRWNDAVLRHDDEAGIATLKQLDPYLTPAEAERMAESARSIFNDRKSKLRDQFTGAVTRRDWGEAIKVGEVIQREFPNAKIAYEVRDTMDALRERAKAANAETMAT